MTVCVSYCFSVVYGYFELFALINMICNQIVLSSLSLDSIFQQALPFPSQFLFLEIFKYFIYLFSERGEVREVEREIKIIVWLPLTCPQLGTWPAAQEYALTGNPTRDPLVHRLALNPLSHTSQGSSQFLPQVCSGSLKE